MSTVRTRLALTSTAVAVLALTAAAPAPTSAQGAPACVPGGPPVELGGPLGPGDAQTYRVLPFDVADGTTRIEVGYSWQSAAPETQLEKTVVDLGLWDEDGYRDPAGFRGWSGSRQGKVAEGQPPVFVEAGTAERGYVPGPIEAGTWYVEVGFGAVHPAGGSWQATVTCLDPVTGPVWQPDPVDPTYVARDEPGWYRGDFHLHAYHSNPEGPAGDEMVEFARAAKLDVVPVTDYVTDTHWGELGPVQRANPDLLLWPGREVITYSGHAVVLGETTSTLEYRHGFEDVDLRDVEEASVADGALFSVAHPTIFPGEALQAFCRGCEFRLGDDIDWDLVDTMEVVTGPVVIDPATTARPAPGVTGVANPFVATAVDLWESLLQQGHRITALSGSDDKLGPGYGQTATMVYADALSRPALVEALRAGHAYVQTKGADASPTVELSGHASPGGADVMMGDTIVATSAELTATVAGAAGQTLVISRDGTEVQQVPITEDPFTFAFTADRDPAEGPLGTFWRVDVRDALSFTAIANPIFLADAQPPAKERGALPTEPVVPPNFPTPTTSTTAPPPASTITTGASSPPSAGGGGSNATLLLIAAGAVSLLGIAFAVRRYRGSRD